jgi:S1-C subfamily serine protease
MGKSMLLVCFAIVLASTDRAIADDRRDSSEMLELLRPATQRVERSMAQVIVGSRPVALAAVVDARGFLITKRSELSGDPIRVRLHDGRIYPAMVAAVRRENDLALLRIQDSVELEPLVFENFLPAMASFLITPGRTGPPIGIGVLGARERSIAHQGRLGVQLDRGSQGGALVADVVKGSGADEAGVIPGDLIIEINGNQYSSHDTVMQALRAMFPGEAVRLTVLRSDKQNQTSRVEVEAEIRDYGFLSETENDSRVNGPRNSRMSGFERVIQHDTVLDPDECGGPVVDSNGRVVGLNIARAGRVVTYALPSSLVNSELSSMMAEAR